MNFLLGEARFYFAQCVFNTSCHYAAYDRYEKERNKRHNIALTISSLSIISLCLTVLCWETSCQVFLRILSLLGILLTAVSLIFELYNKEDITEVMCYHKQAAEDYKQLRDSFMDIIRQVKSKAEISVVESRLHKCLHDYSILGKYSLPTNEQDYVNTQQSLGLGGQGESFTWSSEEIDRFLPIELRENHVQMSTEICSEANKHSSSEHS